MSEQTPIKLKLPKQDLDSFSLFSLDANSAQAWVESLPITNTRLVVQLLRQAVSDLNRLTIDPQVRHEILEVLRPTTHVALSNLSRRFLNQPLIMPDEPLRLSRLSDNLYGLMATAYTIVAVEAIQQRGAISQPARLACEAIYRAINISGQKTLQAFQLYQPEHLNGWQALHQLYALAEQQRLTDLPVSDPFSGNGNITSAYLKPLLLSCCKPSQLRQTDVTEIYSALGSWTQFVKLTAQPLQSSLFLVDLNGNHPPIYSNITPDLNASYYRFVDTEALVTHLDKIRARAQNGSKSLDFGIDVNLQQNILDHIIDCLGEVSQRSFSRSTIEEPMWVCVGFSSVHYHVAQGRTFPQVLYGVDQPDDYTGQQGSNPFLKDAEQSDGGQEARGDQAERRFPISPNGNGSPPSAASVSSLRDRYPIFRVSMVNASPGGYCLEWNRKLPRELATGNIAAVRDPDGKGWVVAVVRWISQLESAKTLVGIELLSPRAEAYGASVHKIAGQITDPMRAFLLPEIPLVGQQPTLVTPRAGFRENQKVSLNRDGELLLLQLQRQISVTGNFSQFNFRHIQQAEEVLAEDKSGPLDSVYDSIWSNI